MRLLFDIEANGLLATITKVHCIAALDLDTEELRSFGPDQIDEALAYLYEADELIAHNGLDYDFRALAKVKNWHPKPGTRRTDTLVISRTIHPDLKREDAKRIGWPKKLTGSHSLKAWGMRLGEHKGDYGYDVDGKPIAGAWDEWSPEMQSYMEQDVRTNAVLLHYLKPWEYPSAPLELEHRVAALCLKMEEAGWPFDVTKAQELYIKLVARRDALEGALVDRFGSWQEVDKVFTPKRDNRTLGYTKGVEVTKYKTVTFNPGSRRHIEKKLREFGWQPTKFNDGGSAKVDEAELTAIDSPEAKDLVEFLLVQKRLGQLADGNNGWLRLVGSDGRMHGRYNHMGTNTSRAAHYSPNLGQVPKVSKPYGAECRALFHVPPGWKQIGADMSGAQLRCLAHYVGHWDKGAYGRIVTDGDVHTYHMDCCDGLIKTRENSKTTIYAFLFGAQAPKLGKINGGDAKAGQQIMKLLSARVLGLGKLRDSIENLCKRGWLKGLDGRLIPIRSPHSALNAVIMCAEAVLCKTWLCNCYDRILSTGLQWGWDKDFVFLGFIHDEIQVAARDEHADAIKEIMVQEARAAGSAYGFRVRLDSEAKVGQNWRDTH